MEIEVYESVWDALEDDPVERERLKMRSCLMMALSIRVKSWRVNQAKAARRLGITRRRMNDLHRDRFNKFSLGDLFDLATRAGLKVTLSIDETGKKTRASKRAA
jgi:predicted XRE-type DNA-binding protein